MAGAKPPESLTFPVRCSLLYEAADAITTIQRERDEAQASLIRTREELGEARRQKERLIRVAHSRDRSWERMRAELSAAREANAELNRRVDEAEQTAASYANERDAAREALKGAEKALKAARGWAVTCSESAKARADIKCIDVALSALRSPSPAGEVENG